MLTFFNISDLTKKFNCKIREVRNFIIVKVIGRLYNPPPNEIPRHLDYTLGGKIPVKKWYVDSRFSDDGQHSLLTSKKTSFERQLKEYLEAVAKRINIHPYYKDTCGWFYDALDKYPIRDKDVVVMGSLNPWVEAMCLYYGARHCTVIEYSTIKCSFPGVRYIKPHQSLGLKFDVGVALSSFEHDGLGRYGDPLNPFADIEAMQNMKKLLRKDGILFLSVPTGSDQLYWNAHRIYGDIRLPLLLEGWKTLEVYGANQIKYEPVRVLQNV